ncbi:RAN, member RAS oncogene family [Homo sapiens]|uniref:RAN, member RAS oncogene family n=2 Tax=Hominidae TaxID=9604 RepID=A0A087X0W0_HUMAN|nr:RAN, member RAS oncogene family [Homo sapiens]KAI4068974.1 RAN, member RAS oncogene family [Homo sapiens]PNJ17156.1 RAN isoform 5 [Pongo abelii]
MAAQGEPQVQFKPSSGLLGSSLETLTWNLLPCLLSPHQKLSWTQLWQHSMSTT